MKYGKMEAKIAFALCTSIPTQLTYEKKEMNVLAAAQRRKEKPKGEKKFLFFQYIRVQRNSCFALSPASQIRGGGGGGGRRGEDKLDSFSSFLPFGESRSVSRNKEVACTIVRYYMYRM